MLTRYLIAGMFSISVLGAGGVSSQDYPNKPIRIVTGGAGGTTDYTARLIAPGLASALGQSVIVENRPSLLATEIVSKAPPDGYTIVLLAGSFYTASLLHTKSPLPFDPVRDFSPITLVAKAPLVVVVHPSLPVKSVKELIALAKAKPGALNYSSGGNGGSTHLSAELFKSMASVNIVRINYKGGAWALNGLIGGEAHLTFDSASAVTPHIKSGRLRALAVTGAEPFALFPGLPTLAVSGLPGYESVQPVVIFAPAKTPEAIINRLSQEVVRYIKTPETRERFLSTGQEVVGSLPEELAVWMKADMARLGKVIKDAGISED